MNSTQLETFIAVSDTLSFARAAERLHVTQPAVTHQIRSLEAELGVSLFVRTTRRVRMTEEGRLFLADAQSIVALWHRSLGRFRYGDDPGEIRLSIGCRSYAHMIFLADVFRELKERYPSIKPDLVVVPHEHLHQLLEDGEVDVVLDYEGVAHRGEAFEKLCGIEVVCLCPAGSPLARRERIWPQDLANEPLALPRPEHMPQSMRENFMHMVASREAVHFYPCDSVEAALMLVEADMAATVLPLLSLPPDVKHGAVPFAAVEPVGFGVYTFGADQMDVIRDFIDTTRRILAR